MSKATYVVDSEYGDEDEISVLRLGVPGDQQQIDEYMLVSSIFIDLDGRFYFGQEARDRSVESTDAGGHACVDNIKRWLSEGNIFAPVETDADPGEHGLKYSDLVLAYLTFLTWTINEALPEVVNGEVPANFSRRFALPNLSRAGNYNVSDLLAKSLGKAQVLSDTFRSDLQGSMGIDVGQFMDAARRLDERGLRYGWIKESLSEPVGVAGSIVSWQNTINSLVLVVDIGAGTTDLSLYRLLVGKPDPDTGVRRSQSREASNAARAITDAGNYLDKLLLAYLLSKGEISLEHPNWMNIRHDLNRKIRDFKERLFNDQYLFAVLRDGTEIEVTLQEFLALEGVKEFTAAIEHAMIGVMESVDSTFVDWVRSDATRFLTVILTGGGASLPMIQQLAEKNITVHGKDLRVERGKPIPPWLEKDYPDLVDIYPRIAVSLGGARKQLITEGDALDSTAGGSHGSRTLERNQTSGL